LNSLHARTLYLTLLAAIVACGPGCTGYPPGIGHGVVVGGDDDDSGIGDGDDFAVFPSNCAPPSFALDGTVWHVTGTAEGKLGGCLALGQIEPLCDMEWSLVADPTSDGLYDVYYDDTGFHFKALLCGNRLYFDGLFPIDLQDTGCVPGAPLHTAHFAGHGTPPHARLTLTDGLPPTGEADAASGVVAVQFNTGLGDLCEWELVLSLTLSSPLPLEHPTRSTGSLVLQGDARLASDLARADLGLLLSEQNGASRWLSMELFAEGAELEIELAPGTCALAITPRPGPSGSTPLSAERVVVRAGCRTSLDWSRQAVLGSPASPGQVHR
jgi:hypothetical protein